MYCTILLHFNVSNARPELSAAPQQFKQVWLHSVCTIIQGVQACSL